MFVSHYDENVFPLPYVRSHFVLTGIGTNDTDDVIVTFTHVVF